MNEKLVEWIKESQSKGYSLGHIKEHLVKEGYSESEADEAVSSASPKSASQSSKISGMLQKLKNPKVMYPAIAGIAAILLITGIFMFSSKADIFSITDDYYPSSAECRSKITAAFAAKDFLAAKTESEACLNAAENVLSKINEYSEKNPDDESIPAAMTALDIDKSEFEFYSMTSDFGINSASYSNETKAQKIQEMINVIDAANQGIDSLMLYSNDPFFKKYYTPEALAAGKNNFETTKPQLASALIQLQTPQQPAMTVTSCKKEGETVVPGTSQCCDGLMGLQLMTESAGKCVQIPCDSASCPGVCAKCGDEICGIGENECNCANDCAQVQQTQTADSCNADSDCTVVSKSGNYCCKINVPVNADYYSLHPAEIDEYVDAEIARCENEAGGTGANSVSDSFHVYLRTLTGAVATSFSDTSGSACRETIVPNVVCQSNKCVFAGSETTTAPTTTTPATTTPPEPQSLTADSVECTVNKTGAVQMVCRETCVEAGAYTLDITLHFTASGPVDSMINLASNYWSIDGHPPTAWTVYVPCYSSGTFCNTWKRGGGEPQTIQFAMKTQKSRVYDFDFPTTSNSYRVDLGFQDPQYGNDVLAAGSIRSEGAIRISSCSGTTPGSVCDCGLA